MFIFSLSLNDFQDINFSEESCKRRIFQHRLFSSVKLYRDSGLLFVKEIKFYKVNHKKDKETDLFFSQMKISGFFPFHDFDYFCINIFIHHIYL